MLRAGYSVQEYLQKFKEICRQKESTCKTDQRTEFSIHIAFANDFDF